MSMTRREHYRRIANRHRAIPGRHGLRPWRVFDVVGSWSGSGHFGDGMRTDAEAEILENGQPPKVREVKAEEVALDAGLQSGDLVVGPITPVIGTAWATLDGSNADGGESFRLRLTNDETGSDLQCVLVTMTRDRALRTMVTVRPVRG